MSDAIKAEIREKALSEGFSTVGFAPVTMGQREQARLEAFVANGEYGEMAWMAERMHHRREPQGLWPEVKTVLVLGLDYTPDENPLWLLERTSEANISCYARNRDYHDLIKKRLKRIARWMVDRFGGDVKVFVDTAPVLEKPLGALSGIGWQGKHSVLVSRHFGSWLFLGEIYMTLEMAPDTPEKDHCGRCRRCLDVCPTDAFPEPYTLDARRCISYLTIEHKGPIPLEFREAIGNRVYGCDDCLAICPWNKFAPPTDEAWFLPRAAVQGAKLADYLHLDDAAFRTMFSGSPVKRIGRDRFLRNVLIACGNSGDISLIPPVEALIDDDAAVVRGAAVWALRKLSPSRFEALREKAAREEDQDVRAEWA
ncbi:tRNA epoxyqueuosine(34) reductase QueG [Rhodospirillaceae bacterium KN72]|uniref:Epoxyqueuosine reductase n=1 Tax=Pacificispira spongiicola TaxID=2729598 RepID=A0A7Y0DXS4_9PROT|nr:tRNA epoxyqueuosine(34) reductase QueG [Pacificispira spongiicola]NMM43562.1 tRNA epoxyqueuosine(34) reductase QueG [Pacificispira spongiicola]